MRRKPSIAGLKRELDKTGLELTDRNQEIYTMSCELVQLHEKIKDLEGDVKSKDREIGWYERNREQNLAWFEESLRLVAPHLVPNPHTGSIDVAGNDPIERLLIETRQRLHRAYDSLGRNLYVSSPR